MTTTHDDDLDELERYEFAVADANARCVALRAQLEEALAVRNDLVVHGVDHLGLPQTTVAAIADLSRAQTGRILINAWSAEDHHAG